MVVAMWWFPPRGALGAADRSYGIHVAKLAGLPAAAVARAEQVLATLEKGEQASALTRLADDLPLFSARIAEARKLSLAVSRPWPPSTSTRRMTPRYA